VILYNKIKASALQFAILVSTIVAILLASFITLSYTHQFFKTQSKFISQTIEQANKGIAYNLRPQNEFQDSIILEENNVHSVIKKSLWGGFEKTDASAKTKTKSYTKIALIGSKVSLPRKSVIVSDREYPLKLVGNSRLEGDALVNEKGILPGYIATQGFDGEKLVYGSIKQNSGVLPEIDPQWIQNIYKNLKYLPSNSDQFILQNSINENSFFNNTQYLYQKGKIVLNEKYSGNIVIKSDTEVTITSNSQLKDVTVIAPRINIQKGFHGAASFIATNRIFIDESVVLSYPSAIINLNEEDQVELPSSAMEAAIFVSDNSIINGVLVYRTKTILNSKLSTNIHIAKNALIKGLIYCEGNVELSGTIMGSIYTMRFIANEHGSKYPNHIFNGKVLGNDIHAEFCGLPFKNSQKGILKWLY
jgi:hypothetical protein